MSDHATFVTRRTYCQDCSDALVAGLEGPKIGPVSRIPSWSHPRSGRWTYLVAGTVRDIGRPELVIEETMERQVKPRLCPGHSVAVVVLGDENNSLAEPYYIEVCGEGAAS